MMASNYDLEDITHMINAVVKVTIDIHHRNGNDMDASLLANLHDTVAFLSNEQLRLIQELERKGKLGAIRA